MWSPTGTTAVHHVCLLMLLSSVLFGAHQVGQVIISLKTTKKKKLNIISIVDRLLSQRGLLSQRLIKSYSTDVTEISRYLFRIDLYLGLFGMCSGKEIIL